MVRLRLRREGRKKRPFYRVVAADSRAPRDGRFIEIVGYYDPLVDPPKVVLNEDKALTWLKRGAQPSETVARLLDKAGILAKFSDSTGKQIRVGVRKPDKGEAPAEPAAPAEEA